MPQEPVFDPRHDAVFQRGYQAGATPRARRPAETDAPAPVGETGAAASGSVSGPDNSAPPAAGTHRRHLAGPSAAKSPDASLTELSDPTLQEATLVPAHERSRVNPFIIALWVIGLALAGGGSWLAVRMVTRSYAYNNNEMTAADMPWDAVYQQLVWTLSPPMIATGVITIIGLLFWHAWHWHAARR